MQTLPRKTTQDNIPLEDRLNPEKILAPIIRQAMDEINLGRGVELAITDACEQAFQMAIGMMGDFLTALELRPEHESYPDLFRGEK